MGCRSLLLRHTMLCGWRTEQLQTAVKPDYSELSQTVKKMQKILQIADQRHEGH